MKDHSDYEYVKAAISSFQELAEVPSRIVIYSDGSGEFQKLDGKSLHTYVGSGVTFNDLSALIGIHHTITRSDSLEREIAASEERTADLRKQLQTIKRIGQTNVRQGENRPQAELLRGV